MMAIDAVDARRSGTIAVSARSRLYFLTRSLARRKAVLFAILLASVAAIPSQSAVAYTPESPEVLAVIDKGLKFLESHTHGDLGGKCLIALAFHQRGASADHPKIKEAIEACRNSIEQEKQQSHLYGRCMAIMFLTELDADKYRDLIQSYVAGLKDHQQAHGGFGYVGMADGDTSQTQYAALAFWGMLNHGISPDADSVQRCLGWLMRTQDPAGLWGFQGVDPGGLELVKQPEYPGLLQPASGLSAAMILGNLVGLLKPPQEETLEVVAELPSALKRVEKPGATRAPALPPGDVDPKRLKETVAAGKAWFDKNFSYDSEDPLRISFLGGRYYYIYSVERLRSIQEFLEGADSEEPEWYNQGFKMLKEAQQQDGSWSDGGGSESATAFAVLFLLRSTQKTIAASLGEGTLVGGRGLPRDLSKVKLRGGKLVVEQKTTEADQLMNMLDDSNSANLDDLLDNPAALNVDNVTAADARRLQQVARSGPAGARVMAVRALARLRDVEYAPTLIFALTDPDKRVVREARDGLRSVSRQFEGYGPSDNFEDAERRTAVQRWKAWYQTVRPEAPPLP